MKKFKTKNNIIIGSIVAYLSILFLSIAIDEPTLAAAGLVIAPASIIYYNKRFTVKPVKYYSSLFITMIVTLFMAGTGVDSNIDNVSQDDYQRAPIENKVETETEIEPALNITEDTTTESSSKDTEDIFEGYKLIEVDGGNLSGHREPNVVVDIGFGDREYWAFTNEYGQLVKVVAKEVILQDDSREPVNSSGRYYPDEAKVPGVESKNLDEGHIIADSLGGVSNAYNITPQNSTLNRHGDQAYMEKVIRDAGGCTDFVAIITYPNTTTQIPSHYSYTYTIKGRVVNDEFDNINPDEYNSKLGYTSSSNSSSNKTNNNKNNSNTSNSSKNNSKDSSSNSSIVYWTPNGNSYHSTKSCSTLSRSKSILEGTVKSSGKYDPCDRCH